MQITIQKMWPLEAGRKSGGFKGTDGTNYYCEIPIYHMLSEGMTIDAPAEKYVSKAGKTSYIIDKKWSPSQAAPQPTNGQHDPNPRYAPAPPRPGNGTAVPFRSPAEMFVCDVVGRAMGSGKFDTQDVKLLTMAAAEAWNEVKGKL